MLLKQADEKLTTLCKNGPGREKYIRVHKYRVWTGKAALLFHVL